ASRAARPDRFTRGGGERGRRVAGGGGFGADGEPDERGGPGELGLAHPVRGRRGARRDGVAGALDDGGIARFRALAAGRRVAGPAAASCARASARRLAPRVRDLVVRLDHLLRGNQLRARVPYLGRGNG